MAGDLQRNVRGQNRYVTLPLYDIGSSKVKYDRHILINSLYVLGGGIGKDMRDFLSRDFASTDEVDIELQDATRDNLYARTVPCKIFIKYFVHVNFLELVLLRKMLNML